MGLSIENGRCGGYPCITELPEMSGIILFALSPFPQYMPRTKTGINKGYPGIYGMPELDSIVAKKAPYQSGMMRCLGEAVNEGYPALMSLNGVSRRIESALFCGDKQVFEMYCCGQFISQAYCGDEKVFGIYYN